MEEVEIMFCFLVQCGPDIISKLSDLYRYQSPTYKHQVEDLYRVNEIFDTSLQIFFVMS